MSIAKTNNDPLLAFSQLNPLYISPDIKIGNKECNLFFPPPGIFDDDDEEEKGEESEAREGEDGEEVEGQEGDEEEEVEAAAEEEGSFQVDDVGSEERITLDSQANNSVNGDSTSTEVEKPSDPSN